MTENNTGRKMIANTKLTFCTEQTLRKHAELFHYTNRGAFESIVSSNKLWATHYASMADDHDEVMLMRERLPAAVAPRFDEIAASLNRKERRGFKAEGGGVRPAKDFVESLYGATFLSKTGFKLDPFIVSFSTHADDTEFERAHGLPSQWKRYAGSVVVQFD